MYLWTGRISSVFIMKRPPTGFNKSRLLNQIWSRRVDCTFRCYSVVGLRACPGPRGGRLCSRGSRPALARRDHLAPDALKGLFPLKITQLKT